MKWHDRFVHIVEWLARDSDEVVILVRIEVWTLFFKFGKLAQWLAQDAYIIKVTSSSLVLPTGAFSVSG